MGDYIGLFVRLKNVNWEAVIYTRANVRQKQKEKEMLVCQLTGFVRCIIRCFCPYRL